MKRIELAIIPLAIVFIAALLLLGRAPAPQSMPEGKPRKEIPDFGSFTETTAKKRHFFQFMLPMVRSANANVNIERRLARRLAQKLASGHGLNGTESSILSRLLHKYRVPRTASRPLELKRLMQRVDVVPASLMLAQSATESAWGTSRFARQGNNFFGIWCYTPGCGMTPKYRDEGLTHEVARFDSVQDGVSRYLYIINTNPAYKALRNIRARRRNQNRPVRGIELAEGLHRYSERGKDYVRDIQAMIRINKLQRFTKPLQVSAND